MADHQTERSYQKQPTVFQNTKWQTMGLGKKLKKRDRYYKSVGLGFKTPREVGWFLSLILARFRLKFHWTLTNFTRFQAIEGTYIDKKCPFTSNVSIRGCILSGVVTKTKMQRTIVVRRDYLHFVPKYRRYEKRHKNITVHCSPAFR